MTSMKNLGGINLKVRLKNPQFLLRTAAAIILPALAFIGIDAQSLTSWDLFFDAVMQIVTNPVAIGIIVLNIANLIPDPTRNRLADSELVLDRETPKVKEHKAAK